MCSGRVKDVCVFPAKKAATRFPLLEKLFVMIQLRFPVILDSEVNFPPEASDRSSTFAFSRETTLPRNLRSYLPHSTGIFPPKAQKRIALIPFSRGQATSNVARQELRIAIPDFSSDGSQLSSNSFPCTPRPAFHSWTS